MQPPPDKSIDHNLKFDLGYGIPVYKRIMTMSCSFQTQENVPWTYLSLFLPV